LYCSLYLLESTVQFVLLHTLICKYLISPQIGQGVSIIAATRKQINPRWLHFDFQHFAGKIFL